MRLGIVLVSMALPAFSLNLEFLTEKPPDLKTIIERSVEAGAKDWKVKPTYDCLERDVEVGGSTKTYEDRMIDGSPYQRLVEVDGKALSPDEAREEQRKLDETISRRRNESEHQRQQRIAKYEKDRRRNHLMMEQLTKAFDFTLDGEQRLDGHQVYVLKARPRPGYRPPNMETEALRGMQGQLWIDEKTFEWVKVEARVVHPVSIEGFLARVEPGTQFELERKPVEDGIWLPSHFTMKSRAKVFFLFPQSSQEDDMYYGYHKSGTAPVTSHASRWGTGTDIR
ncbi:MAG TPA: hypothetical protein VMG31_07645 [Verrucomicrobiae bacterium]|nr:hypothetical protein [Verrucomicrobiae bacterium]